MAYPKEDSRCHLVINQDDRRDSVEPRSGSGSARGAAGEARLHGGVWTFCNKLPYPIRLYLYSRRKGISDLIGGIGARSSLSAKITKNGVHLEKGDSIHAFYIDSRRESRGVLYEILRSGDLFGDKKLVEIGGVVSLPPTGGMRAPPSLTRTISRVILVNHITIPIDVYLISTSDSTARCLCTGTGTGPKKCPPKRGWEKTVSGRACGSASSRTCASAGPSPRQKLICTEECKARRLVATLEADGLNRECPELHVDNSREGFAIGDQLEFVFSHDQTIYGRVTLTADTGKIFIGKISSFGECEDERVRLGADLREDFSLPFSTKKIYCDAIDGEVSERAYGL